MCVCGSRISDEILIKINQEKWEELKQMEVGLGRPSEVKVAKFKCYSCGQNNILEDIRKFDCAHDYCIKCIRNLMLNYKPGPPLKCKCYKDIEMEVLEGVDKGLYDSYTYKLGLSRGNIQGKGPKVGNKWG